MEREKRDEVGKRSMERKQWESDGKAVFQRAKESVGKAIIGTQEKTIDGEG